MNKSESIKEIAIALNKAHLELKNISFDAENPFHKSKYASLAHILQEVRPVLTKHGLSIIQSAEYLDEDTILVKALILHVSGEWLERGFPVSTTNGKKKDAQTYMAALSYGRRGLLSAILNLSSEEDDDGNSLAKKQQQPQQKQQPQQQQEYLDFSAIQKEIDGMTRDEAVICYTGYKNRRNLTVEQKKSIEKIFTGKFGEKK